MLGRTIAILALSLPLISFAQTPATRNPVLVELFTSEGCSSCPPADALLARLDHDQPIPSADVIVLGEHVDYWDSLGWHDRFSSHSFTERQSRYSLHFGLPEVYTPQMVVGGLAQINGSDARAAAHAIVQAARTPGLPLLLTEPKLSGKRLSASVSLAQSETKVNGDLWAALVSPLQTTEVRSGENGGHTLRHVGVVRSLTSIGRLSDLKHGPHAFSLKTPDSSEPLRLVVFAQTADQGPILGAASLVIPGSPQESLAAVNPSR